MGTFNYIQLPCPKCGELNKTPCQSKGGDCTMDSYNLSDASYEDLNYLVNEEFSHRIGFCDDCNIYFNLRKDEQRKDGSFMTLFFTRECNMNGKANV